MLRPLSRRLLLVASLLVLIASPGIGRASVTTSPCSGWTQKVLASGLGSLENVEPDGRGGLLYSASARSAVERLTPDGKSSTVASGITSPGGLRVRGTTLYVNQGDAAADGALGHTTGTIEEVNLRTGHRTTWASGLTMPNGLLFLPDGSALTSRDVAGLNPTGITRVARRGAAPQPMWSSQADSNGMAVDPTGQFVYADETFTLASNVYKIRISNPKDRVVVASLAPQPIGVPNGLDDLTISTSGLLYVAANSGGEVIRLDPRTKTSCVVASGLMNTSAVKQGKGSGAFPATRLYVVGFDGKIVELAPPRGVTV